MLLSCLLINPYHEWRSCFSSTYSPVWGHDRKQDQSRALQCAVDNVAKLGTFDRDVAGNYFTCGAVRGAASKYRTNEEGNEINSAVPCKYRIWSICPSESRRSESYFYKCWPWLPRRIYLGWGYYIYRQETLQAKIVFILLDNNYSDVILKNADVEREKQNYYSVWLGMLREV